MTSLTLVVPEGVDDPARPSGGNVYDRRLRDGLTARGWRVAERRVPGARPEPGPHTLAALAAALAAADTGSLVLLDGLVASGAAPAVLPHAGRLTLVTLVHLPFGPSESERAVLRASASVLTTSDWTRRWLLDRYRLAPDLVTVVPPGVDPAPVAACGGPGDRLLSVGAVTRVKGADVLVEALGRLSGLRWRAEWVGSRDVDPECAAQVSERARALGVHDRLACTGPRTGAALATAYAAADLLVAPSRTESYGLVLGEALARGIPVVVSEVGGVREAIGHSGTGELPGLLVPPEDPEALAGALRAWLTHPELRRRLRAAALDRRRTLRRWSDTVDDLEAALRGLVPEPAVPS